MSIIKWLVRQLILVQIKRTLLKPMFCCPNPATLGNITGNKIVVRSPQPGDIGKP